MNTYDTIRVVDAVVKIADALAKLARAQTDIAWEAKQANKIKERQGR